MTKNNIIGPKKVLGGVEVGKGEERVGNRLFCQKEN